MAGLVFHFLARAFSPLIVILFEHNASPALTHFQKKEEKA